MQQLFLLWTSKVFRGGHEGRCTKSVQWTPKLALNLVVPFFFRYCRFSLNLESLKGHKIGKNLLTLLSLILAQFLRGIKMRVFHQNAALLAPILPRDMEEGESKKAALILMKNSHFDGTLL